MNWGEELRAFRARNNIKQEAAAHMLEVSQAYVSRLESGAQGPSPEVEMRLRALLTAPAHRPVFDYIKALVSRSPHITFLFSLKECQIWVEAASCSALALSGRLDDSAPKLVVGQSLSLGDRPEVHGTVSRMIEEGGFEGRLAFVDAIWFATVKESGETLYFRNTLIPMRDEMARWFMHGTTRIISQAEYQRLKSEWGGMFKIDSHTDDAVETSAYG
ncbi:MAG: helix-turn-helix domain-containing protein [Oceanicaulis sp.]|nr:helix-turn-helix domain-containing protein [Oceanicaulis sp.]